MVVVGRRTICPSFHTVAARSELNDITDRFVSVGGRNCRSKLPTYLTVKHSADGTSYRSRDWLVSGTAWRLISSVVPSAQSPAVECPRNDFRHLDAAVNLFLLTYLTVHLKRLRVTEQSLARAKAKHFRVVSHSHKHSSYNCSDRTIFESVNRSLGLLSRTVSP